jgi:hypothetical protein
MDRRPGMKLSVVVAVVLVSLVAIVSASAASVTARTEMAMYIRQMAPLNAKIVKAENRLTKAQLGFLGGKVTEAEADAAARAFTRDVRDAYLGMKAIKPPAALKGPHAGFVLTVKTEFTKGGASPARKMAALKAHWRQEVTAQLRRVGLSVPLWVKQVRWYF